MHIVPPAVKTAVALAMGAATLAATTAAQAVVVYTPVNIAVPATADGVYVNVVTGASAGLPAGAPGWDINVWSATGLGFFNPPAPAGGVYVVTAPGVAANLAPGAVVGPARTFSNGVSTNVSQWNLNSTNNYFGFRFINETGGTLHYGFAQLRIGATITDRSIIAIGYENVANTAITVVPEPGTYGLMALGLAAVAFAARRRQQA